MIFNIDLAELDTGPAELCLEPYAIATPASGEDDRVVCGHQIHSHNMYNSDTCRCYFLAAYCVRHIAGMFRLFEPLAEVDADRVAFLLADHLP